MFIRWLGKSCSLLNLGCIFTLNENVLPSPSTLLTLTLPPINSHSCFTIVSPRPVPPNWRVVEVSACVNELNNDVCWFLLIPIPVSITEHSKKDPSVESSTLAIIITSPFLVNLTALPIKLLRICLSLFGSLIISLTVIWVASKISFVLFCSTFSANDSTTSPNNFGRLN